jgi:methylenetetrahydrofolate--tRNA-(uracil-5-)-methyltransferase
MRFPVRPGSSRARVALTRGASKVAHRGLSQSGMLQQTVLVIGGGLAGCEAAWQAAQRGARVQLCEMRPFRMTPAHRTDRLAELVCSNSLGSKRPDRALGLLKNELRRLGSLLIACADLRSVPAGDALAVGRDEFSQAVTAAVEQHPRIEVLRKEVTSIPEACAVVIATGPLTSTPMAEQIGQLAGQEHLYFFDAMAPVVAADSIDMTVAFRANRYSGHRGEAISSQRESVSDYINCPLNREEYYAFVRAVIDAEKAVLREFEQDEAAKRYFEACLPIEVMAIRSPDALAFGPMRPVGLIDPRTGRWPFAAVQLRQDDLAGTLYNIVGFQTNIRWGEQERVLRMIPGLQHAEFVRLGQMHRNTFINSPMLLRPTLQWHKRDDLLLAGQLVGTEGYVGSVASGFVAGLNAARVTQGLVPVVFPPTTMIGALLHYVTHAESSRFQPTKANFGLLPDLESPIRDRQGRQSAFVVRALSDLEVAISTGQLVSDEVDRFAFPRDQ